MITPEKKIYISRSENLGLGGIFLLEKNPLPVRAVGILNLTFNIEDERKDISFKFKVVHNGHSQKGFPGMGVEFIDMSQADEAVLEKIVAQIDNS